MNAVEFQNWSNYMISRRGKWSIDLVHDGVNRDLLAFLPDEGDETKGVYVSAHGSTIEAGTYEDAIPHMGEALFTPRWGMTLRGEGEVTPAEAREFGYPCCKPSAGVWRLIAERLGGAFLLGVMCDVPARSVR